MPATMPKKLLCWNGERQAALDAWVARGAELGVSFISRGQHSDAAAVGLALERAAACRCADGKGLAMQDCVEAVEEVQRAANPLRSLREAAGLSQSQMARKMGVSKRAVQLSEARAVASPDTVERARKALGEDG